MSTTLRCAGAVPWAPDPVAAPVTRRLPNRIYVTAANGTRTCCGGWQFEFPKPGSGRWYRLAVTAWHPGLAVPRDALLCTAFWETIDPGAGRYDNHQWDYLIPQPAGHDRTVFSTRVRAPAGAGAVTVRCTLRWATAGRVRWSEPIVTETSAPPHLAGETRVAVVTGHMHARAGRIRSIEDNVRFYAGLCRAVCREARPDLIALPEIAMQWQVPRERVLDLARPAPGPETEAFAAIARRHRAHIVLGMLERERDAVFNSAILIGPDGALLGRYRKMHLAVGGEAESGIRPGDDCPVFDTAAGRIGCNICMDTSAAEASRLVGLGGADFLVLPIMGDHRSDRWSTGTPIFDDGRWLAIQRTRALDNQLCMVIARNEARGSCIIDRRGDVLAWNDGDRDVIHAVVPRDDGYRTWNGGCFRECNWLQRRPHVYGAFTAPDTIGSLRPGCPGHRSRRRRPSEERARARPYGSAARTR